MISLQEDGLSSVEFNNSRLVTLGSDDFASEFFIVEIEEDSEDTDFFVIVFSLKVACFFVVLFFLCGALLKPDLITTGFAACSLVCLISRLMHSISLFMFWSWSSMALFYYFRCLFSLSFFSISVHWETLVSVNFPLNEGGSFSFGIFWVFLLFTVTCLEKPVLADPTLSAPARERLVLTRELPPLLRFCLFI